MTNRAHWLILGASFTLIFALGGWKLAFAAALGSIPTAIACFAFVDSQRGERAWIWSTLFVWAFVALVVTQGPPAACGPDDPAGCFIRR
jgi:hypothetical protein